MRVLQLTLLAVFLGMIVTGVIAGDMFNGIFIKAINICLECIGIG